jgi:hypothetical protein
LALFELDVSVASLIELRSKNNLPDVEGLGRAMTVAMTLHQTKEESIFKIQKATNKTYAKTDQKHQKTSKL